MTQQGLERSFVGLTITESSTSKKIPPAVAPKPKIHSSAPAPFRPGGSTYRQFRDQGNDDIPPPPPQTNYQDDPAFPPPPPEESRSYMYQEIRDDFPPPPPQEIAINYTRQSPEPGQRGNVSSGYSSSNIGYGESPPSRSFEGQYNSSGTQYTYHQDDRQNPYIKPGSPAGRSSPYNPPSNYANLSSIQSAYSSSGPVPQVDNTIYARPVKVNRDSPELGNYGRPGNTDPPVGYVRRTIQEHRLNDQQCNQDFSYNHPGSGGPPSQHSPPYSARSGGFMTQYDYEDRSDRPLPGPQVPQALSRMPEPQQLSPDKSQKEAEVDALTSLLLQNMESASEPDFFDGTGQNSNESVCVKCGKKVVGENNGCLANDQVYHIACFVCVSCGTLLRGKSFYSMDSKPYCENCYVNTLEKCSVCSKPITDRLLRATGKPYHPACFTCVVCGISLDGIPFTVDATNQIHCIEDFHKKFAPRCCVCQMPIMPERGQEETVRVVAMDKSFHVQCYRCEDCGLLLSSEAEGRGCYPLDDHILCKNCNAKRIQAMSSKMATEL